MRRPHGDGRRGRRGGCARTRSSSSRACRPTPRRARRSSRCSTTPRRSSRGSRSTRRSSTCAGWGGSGHAGRDRRPAAAATCASGSACRSPSASPARSSWPRWRARVAKPDGLLVVPPDGELAFLHPLPVERLWGVGPVTAAQAARARDHDGRAGRAARRGRAGRRCSAAPSGRHLHALAHNRDPRPRAARPAAPLDRLAARARPRADGRPRRSTPSLVGARRPASRAGCARPAASAARSCCGCASTTSRARRARTRCPRRPRRRRRSSPRREGCSPTAHAADRAARASRWSAIAVTNLDDDGAVQLALPFDRRSGGALDAALDDVRDRFGSAPSPAPCSSAATRAIACRMLPD